MRPQRPCRLAGEQGSRIWLCGREPCLVKVLRGARGNLAYIEVDGDAALDVIGGISSK